jgi:hypothetical protein
LTQVQKVVHNLIRVLDLQEGRIVHLKHSVALILIVLKAPEGNHHIFFEILLILKLFA